MLAIILLPFITRALALDVITLKNGRVIVADSSREENDKIHYTIGDNDFAISKALVESIVAGDPKAVTESSTAPKVDIAKFQVPAPASLLQLSSELPRLIAPNRQVDVDVLNKIVAEGPAERSAAALYVAAHQELALNDLKQALRYLEQARTFMPKNDLLMDDQASVLLKMGHNREAVESAESAARLAPNTAMGFTLLGLAYFNLDRSKDAAAAFTRSLKLQPDDQVKEMLEKVQRELATDEKFQSETSPHFKMRFEGGQVSAVFRHELLQALEDHFHELVSEIGYTPPDDIPVILYTQQQFFDVTRAPTWTGALNDGKLRIPIQGLSSVGAELSKTLKHELAHSFINQLTRGRCPAWLNEGVAQLLEPRSTLADGHELALIYGAGKNVPLNQLEGGFTSYSGISATIAYVESLAAVEHIRDVYGMSSVSGIMRRIGEGMSTEAALRAEIHSGYDGLAQELSASLKQRYGK